MRNCKLPSLPLSCTGCKFYWLDDVNLIIFSNCFFQFMLIVYMYWWWWKMKWTELNWTELEYSSWPRSCTPPSCQNLAASCIQLQKRILVPNIRHPPIWLMLLHMEHLDYTHCFTQNYRVLYNLHLLLHMYIKEYILYKYWLLMRGMVENYCPEVNLNPGLLFTEALPE